MHGTYFVLLEESVSGSSEGNAVATRKEYVIKASTVEEKERWVKDITAACEFANKAAKSLNNSKCLFFLFLSFLYIGIF